METEDQAKVSIIVPVHNAEAFLSECIESILGQTYNQFNLILVNDGSTDNSGEICDQYVGRDKRVHVIHQENRGVSCARNAGLSLVSTTWVTFVDSDDMIESKFLEVLKGTKDSGADLGMVGIDWFHELDSDKESVLNGREKILEILFTKYRRVLHLVWNKVFRMDIIRNNNIKFPEDISLGEDQIFVLKYLSYTEKMWISLELCYNQREASPNSLGSKIRSLDSYYYSIVANHSAMMELFSRTSSKIVHENAVDYILNRFYTKIVFPYSVLSLTREFSRDDLVIFEKDILYPWYKKLYSELKFVKSKRVKFFVFVVNRMNAIYSTCIFIYAKTIIALKK